MLYPELLIHQWNETFENFEKSKILLQFHKAFGPKIVSFFWKKKRETYKSYNISWQHKMNVTRFLFP